MEKWIRVYASNTNSESLWNVEPPLALDPDEFPISDALKLQLADWMDRWRVGDLRGDTAALDRFAADGREIAKSFKAELPDYKVNYHDWAVCAGAEVDRSIDDNDPKPWDCEITL